jgi:hypothetical protein
VFFDEGFEALEVDALRIIGGGLEAFVDRSVILRNA